MKILLIGILPPYDATFSLGLASLKSYALQLPELAGRVQITIQLFRTDEVYIPGEGIASVNPILQHAYELHPDIVGFSCYAWNVDLVLHLVPLLKLIMPNMPVILGGPEVSPIATEILDQNSYVDFAVRGEGERPFADVICSLLTGTPELKEILGLTYRQQGQIISNPSGPPLDDLDRIPSIYASELVPEAHNKQRVLWETCRGCLFNCHYCYYGGDDRHQIRSHSMGRIQGELSHLMTAGVESITCIDATFNYDPDRTSNILRFILEHNQRSRFLFSIKVELLTEENTELLNALAEQGSLGEVEIGLQSTNSHALKLINRAWQPQRFREVLSWFGPSLRAVSRIDLIYGLPGDTHSGFRQSLEYVIQALGIERISVYLLNVLPGTYLYKHAESLGLVFGRQAPHAVFSSDTYSYCDILQSRALAKGLSLWAGTASRTCARVISQELGVNLTYILEQYTKWVNSKRLSEETKHTPLAAAGFFTELCVRHGRSDLIPVVVDTSLKYKA